MWTARSGQVERPCCHAREVRRMPAATKDTSGDIAAEDVRNWRELTRCVGPVVNAYHKQEAMAHLQSGESEGARATREKSTQAR